MSLHVGPHLFKGPFLLCVRVSSCDVHVSCVLWINWETVCQSRNCSFTTKWSWAAFSADRDKDQFSTLRCYTCTLTHWLSLDIHTHSLTHRQFFISTPVHKYFMLSFTPSFTVWSHILTQSLTHSLTPSFTCTLTLSLPHSLTLSLPHSLTLSLPHSLTHSLTHSLSHSLTHSLTPSLTHSLTHPLTHSITHSLTHSLSHSLFHLHTHTHSCIHSSPCMLTH